MLVEAANRDAFAGINTFLAVAIVCLVRIRFLVARNIVRCLGPIGNMAWHFGHRIFPPYTVVCNDIRKYTIAVMKTKSKTFQMRLQATEYRALKLLAARQGVSMSALLANHIRREAKKKGIPV